MSDTPIEANFDEIRDIIRGFHGPNEKAQKIAQDREGQLTKPPGALGRLEEISEWFATWQAKDSPSIERPRVAVFAGNHGVAKQGVSAFPQEVTVQMVANFKNGGAAVNQLCRAHDAELRVYEMALDQPTHDFTEQPAMSEEECATAIAYGMMAVEEGVDVLCIGEMGIANTTSGAALAYALFNGEAADWVGPGTGVEGDAYNNKIRVVQEAVGKYFHQRHDPLEILRCLGGYEIAAMVGAIIAARMGRVPVILDGYTTCAAAAVLYQMDPAALDHCIVGHLSAEPSHIQLLEEIDKEPLLNYGMRLGEASGAALALGIVKSAIACHTGMATFAEAGVSDKD
ncbi:nicotinate-nucleotide--dimethylbenzimidazole phosphoribosyltransferase [Curvivirga sp.]|uniref:nicotinate-nucleotide--dimethylbenzimidazole phosphoribosyltransferase n=1 Tax=Curvivirga sp. TaxID=2856848 RepID=UPI003B5B8A88